MVKTDRKGALDGLAIESSQDLTKIASVASNIPLENVEALKVLRVKIQGIPSKNVQLQGGRQTFKGQVLTVEKEVLSNLASQLRTHKLAALEKIFLRPGPFIQSDDQKIRDLARKILEDAPDAPPVNPGQKTTGLGAYSY